MVLIGLRVDPVAERMAKFISRGPLDVSVVTFQGFMCGRDRLLGRPMKAQPGQRQLGRRPRYETVDQKRRALREYLERHSYDKVFDQVHADLRQSLPERGVREEAGKTGIGFQLSEPDHPAYWKTYIGVQAGYRGLGYSVSILPRAIRWGEKVALKRLRKAINLSERARGGFALSFDSERKWKEFRPVVLEFIKTVMANRSASRRQEA